MGVPHSAQNLSPSRSSCPQLPQYFAIGAPPVNAPLGSVSPTTPTLPRQLATRNKPCNLIRDQEGGKRIRESHIDSDARCYKLGVGACNNTVKGRQMEEKLSEQIEAVIDALTLAHTQAKHVTQTMKKLGVHFGRAYGEKDLDITQLISRPRYMKRLAERREQSRVSSLTASASPRYLSARLRPGATASHNPASGPRRS